MRMAEVQGVTDGARDNGLADVFPASLAALLQQWADDAMKLKLQAESKERMARAEKNAQVFESFLKKL